MSAEEVDRFLGVSKTCRLASVGPTGPHVTALWFVWHDGALWITSLVKSQRWRDLERDPRVAAIVDDGDSYGELRGVELRGRVEVVGEVPRQGVESNPTLDSVERAFALKYLGTEEASNDGRHAWLRLLPEKLVSWDFRKLPE